jgi:hypothetical protein
MTDTIEISTDKLEAARSVVAWYTLAATGTGAVPVPAASAAVVSETAAMLTHLASTLGARITWATLFETMGLAATLNIAGRTVFIEGAKLLGWGTGNGWAAVALSGLGATTAGVQTYIIGRLAIEIGKNGGRALLPDAAALIIEESRRSYDEFVAHWKMQGVKAPVRASTPSLPNNE